MRKMSKEEQVQMNGGLLYYSACVMGDYMFSAVSRSKLQKKGYAHFKAKGTAHRWNYL